MLGRMATNSLVSRRIANIVMKNIINAASSVHSRSILAKKHLSLV